MTKAEFIQSVEAKATFIKWVEAPVVKETVGEGIEKWCGLAYMKTDAGANTVHVWFIWDSLKDEAQWQTADTFAPQERIASINSYLKDTFDAFFVLRIDVNNDWAEADVFVIGATVLTKRVLVYRSSGVITHKDIQ